MFKLLFFDDTRVQLCMVLPLEQVLLDRLWERAYLKKKNSV